jgi:hypothetical protein
MTHSLEVFYFIDENREKPKRKEFCTIKFIDFMVSFVGISY